MGVELLKPGIVPLEFQRYFTWRVSWYGRTTEHAGKPSVEEWPGPGGTFRA